MPIRKKTDHVGICGIPPPNLSLFGRIRLVSRRKTAAESCLNVF